MENKETAFSFTYSAAHQKEIEEIRKKYLPQAENKMDQLRRLDASATRKAQAWSLSLGILGALLLGTGMSFFMTDLGEILGAYRQLAIPLGIVIGVAGIVLATAAYPTYNHVLKKERQRIAPAILQMTEDLLK